MVGGANGHKETHSASSTKNEILLINYFSKKEKE